MATYYVNASSGYDSSAGTSETTAWQNHPWMSTWTGSVTLAAGDTVCMNRGDTWSISTPTNPYVVTQQSGTAGNPITTTWYGTGNKPIIKVATATAKSVIWVYGCSYITFDNLHIQHNTSVFTDDENYSGIYVRDNEGTPSHHVIITNCEIDTVPYCCILGGYNSYNITVGDVTATSCATTSVYSNNLHDFGYGAVMLYGCDPVSLESNFNVYYNYIHDATQTNPGDNEYGIAFSATASSPAWPKYATARFNYVENIDTWEGIECHGGEHIYILDNYIKNFGTCGILLGGTPGTGSLPATSSYLFAERNIIEQPSSGWINSGVASFIVQYSSDTTTIPSNIYIRDNNCFYTSRPATGPYYGIRIGNVDTVIVTNNNLYNGSTTNGNGSIIIEFNTGTYGNKNVTISKNYSSEWGPGIVIIGTAVTGTININDNIFNKPAADAVIYMLTGDIPSGGSLNIYNNVFLLASTYYYIFETNFGIAVGGSVIAKNNILGREVAGATTTYWYWGGTISGTFECDHNLYWNSSYATPFYYGGSARNWAYWTRTLELDTNSPNVAHGDANLDPRFVQETSTFTDAGDFYIQSDSSARAAGTYVALTTDYVDRAYLNPPSIGAYEYTGRVFFVKEDGSDNYSGTNDASAWQHHPWMSTWTGSVTLAAGDTVCMNRGDTWSISSPVAPYMTVGQNGTEGSPIITTSYGTGVAPIIKIATDSAQPVIYAEGKSYITLNSLEINHFSKEKDIANSQWGILVKKSSDGTIIPHDWIITNCIIHDIPLVAIEFYGDAYNITIGDINAISCATDSLYSNHIYDCGYAGISLTGKNPSTDRSDFYVYYNYIHDIDYVGITDANAYGIAITAYNVGTAQNQSHGWPIYVIVKYNRVTNVHAWEGIDSHGGSYLYILDNYIYDCRFSITMVGTQGVNMPDRLCDHWYIDRNTIVHSGALEDYTIDINACSSDSADTRATQIYIRDNICYWEVREAGVGQIGIRTFASDGVVISGNNLTNGPTGSTNGAIYIEATGGQKTKNINIFNNYVNCYGLGMRVYTEDLDGPINIYNNILIVDDPNNYDRGVILFVAGTPDAGTVITVYNNTLIQKVITSTSTVINFSYFGTFVLPADISIIVKNNILAYSSTSTAGYYILSPATITGTFTVDNNLYYNCSYATPFILEEVGHNFADWQGHGYDVNSLNNINPRFVQETSTFIEAGDLYLKSDSSAIAAGTYVGLSTDYVDRPYKNPPSIGAYEYTGRVFYVRSDGSDNYSGTNDASAWQHHPWMFTWTGSVTLQAGDTVKMKRGDVWTNVSDGYPYMAVGQSGIAGNHITTTAYGSGNKPVIYTSSVGWPVIWGAGKSFLTFDNLEIKHRSSLIDVDGGECGIIASWSEDDESHDWIITNCDIHDCPQWGINFGHDPYNIIVGDINATSTATPTSYSNRIYDCGYGGMIFSGCEASTGNSNVYVYYNYIHNINTLGDEGENSYGVSFSTHIVGTSNGTHRYCYTRYNYLEKIPTWTALDAHNGSYMYFTDNYMKDVHNGVGCQPRDDGGYIPVLHHIYVERNTFENTTDDVYNSSYFVSIQGDPSYINSNIYITDNLFFYTSTPSDSSGAFAIKLTYVDGAIIHRNTFHTGPPNNCSGAIWLQFGCDNVEISNNYIKEWSYAFNLQTNGEGGDINIHNNIVRPGRGVLSWESDTITGNVNIYNNSFLSPAFASYFSLLRFNSTTLSNGASLKIKNNIFGYDSVSTCPYVVTPSTINGTFESDYNLYWNYAGSAPFEYLGSNHTFTAWQAHGFDTNSPNISNSLNPLFKNRSGLYSLNSDLDLQNNSPAIDTGTDINLRSDYAGRYVRDIPDIGAYEHIPYRYSKLKYGGKYIVRSGKNVVINEPASSLLDGLVAYWDFEESAGNLLDKIGNMDGSLSVNGITQRESGIVGNCYFFDGVKGANASLISFLSTIDTGTSYTVSAWLKWDDSLLNSQVYLAGSGENSLFVYNDSSTDAFPCYWQGQTTAADIKILSFVWSHCVMRVDNSVGLFYINGVEHGNTNITMDSWNIFQIGDPTYNYRGHLDEIGIWNRALTPNEIYDLYNKGAGITYPFTGITNTNFLKTDGNTVAWYMYDASVTKDASDYVNLWADTLGSTHDLIQNTSTNKPLYNVNGILFDGDNDYMRTNTFTWNQPEMIYVVAKVITVTAGNRLFDGSINNSGCFFFTDNSSIYSVVSYAGSENGATTFTPDKYIIFRVAFNGVNSFVQLNNDAPAIGDAGSSNMNGFVLANSGGLGNAGNIEVKEIICRRVIDTPSNQTTIYNYLKTKYQIDSSITVDNSLITVDDTYISSDRI